MNIDKKKKPCRLFSIAVALATLALVSGQATAAQIISEIADTSAALRVKNGYDTTLTIVVTTNGDHFVITAGALVTTFNCQAVATNISELATKILATTNAAGTASLTVDQDCALAADSTDTELLNGTYTAVAGAWLELPWNTSAHLSYDLYLPDRSIQTGVAPYILGTVQCLPEGTGNVTASVYKNRVLIARKVITSPVYVWPATVGGTNDTTMTADANVNLDWVLNMPFGGKDPVIVRVGRATTATDGGVINAVIPNP